MANQIILVTEKSHARHKELLNVAAQYDMKVIDFYTQNFEELSFVAKHRVVVRPAIIIVDGMKTVARIVHIPEKEKLTKILDRFV